MGDETPEGGSPVPAMDEESGPDSSPVPDYLTVFEGLRSRARLRVLIPTFFVVWHIAVVLLWGAGDRVREVVRPVIGFYASGLKLAGTWGMFSAPARMHVTFVYGVKENRERFLLSPNPKASLLTSLVDMRERKMRTRLGDEDQRNSWGNRYLDSFCQAPDRSWFQRIELEAAEHDEHHRWGTRKVLLVRPCFFAHKQAQTGKDGGKTP